MTIPISPLHNAIKLVDVSFPKLTILNTVSATFELKNVIIKTPKKLKIEASISAFLGVKLLVDTQVAIAFGTSEHPLMYITADINMVVISRLGVLLGEIAKI